MTSLSFFLVPFLFFLLGVNVGFDLRVKFDDTDRNIKRLEVITIPAGLSMKINDYLGNDTVSERVS